MPFLPGHNHKKISSCRTGDGSSETSSTNRSVAGMEAAGMLATGWQSFNLFIINLHLAMALVSSAKSALLAILPPQLHS